MLIGELSALLSNSFKKLGLQVVASATQWLAFEAGAANFDITLDHPSPISQLYVTPHAPHGMLLVGPMLVGC